MNWNKAIVVALTVSVAACSSKKASPDGSPGAGGGGAAGTSGALQGCSDLFDENLVRTYSIDISPDEMTSLQAEFNNVATLMAQGNDFVVRHPVTFHMGSETVSDATLKLHGQSSWAQAATLDGNRGKMQFDISFHQSDRSKKFHGVEKLVFDMPRSDWTFLHDRIAHAWFRQVGITAGCAASARVEINGSYYGLYVAEENTGKRVIEEYFADNPNGDLWKAGNQPETNQTSPNWDRQAAFWRATDISSLSAIVDLPSSVMEWAGEALINDADGIYGGTHNFYIYDQGAKGFVFLPNDTDSTFEWMSLFDNTPSNNHPIYTWEGRGPPSPVPSPIWLVAMNDPATRKTYVDAIAAQLNHWDVGQIQGWIDTWSGQIADAVAADPHTWATVDQFHSAVAAAHDIVAARAQFLKSFVDCEKNGSGADQDGDGFRWCEDCRDADPSVHPGAAEICGNGVDDNCNGTVDENCAASH
jgi:hypothetical protein